MLSLLALVACANQLEATPEAPFALPNVETAAWIDLDGPEDGLGEAVLLMIDEPTDCAKLAEQYGDTFSDSTDVAWTASGIEVRFILTAGEAVASVPAWAGTYSVGASTTGPDVVLRSLEVLVYEAGTVWALYDAVPGQAIVQQIGADEAEGVLEHTWFEGTFRAERCAAPV